MQERCTPQCVFFLLCAGTSAPGWRGTLDLIAHIPVRESCCRGAPRVALPIKLQLEINCALVSMSSMWASISAPLLTFLSYAETGSPQSLWTI